MSITNSQQLSIQITDCPRTEAVAPFFRMEGTEWWRHNTPLILLCETLERENAALKVQVRELIDTMEEEGEMDAVRIAALRHDNNALRAAIAESEEFARKEGEAARKFGQENAALKSALDAQMQYQRDLRADRDRLDWLQANGHFGYVVGSTKADYWAVDLPLADQTTIRAAIDAAREESCK